MEGAMTDTQVSAGKPFPPKMVKQAADSARPTDQQMDMNHRLKTEKL